MSECFEQPDIFGNQRTAQLVARCCLPSPSHLGPIPWGGSGMSHLKANNSKQHDIAMDCFTRVGTYAERA